MNISIATTADIPELNKLINSAYRGESSKKGWTTEAHLLDGVRTDEKSLAAIISATGATLLACRNEAGSITGCVYLQKETGTFYLGMLTVSPSLQAAGIGGRLLQYAETFVRNNYCSNITMTVVSVRHELIAWYERHGYAKTGETRPFPTDPAFGIPKQTLEFVVMKKKLSDE
ncbi:MAG: GNAT family N-acetyltransferase [Chitinophagaceae bacterium]